MKNSLSRPTGQLLVDDVLQCYLHINKVLEEILVFYVFVNDTPVGYIQNAINSNNESIRELKKLSLFDRKNYNEN